MGLALLTSGTVRGLRNGERRVDFSFTDFGAGTPDTLDPAGKSTMAAETCRGKAPVDGVAPPTTPEERRALDAVFSAAYEELRRLAASVRRGAGGDAL